MSSGLDLYISAHNKQEAERAAELLKAAGHKITATWLTRKEGEERTNFRDIDESDALVLLASPYRVPGGKFVEAGYAYGVGAAVYVVGHFENSMMPLISGQFDSVENLIEALAK